jgi:hypothetical protein
VLGSPRVEVPCVYNRVLVGMGSVMLEYTGWGGEVVVGSERGNVLFVGDWAEARFVWNEWGSGEDKGLIGI